MKTRLFFFIGICLGLLSMGRVFAQENSPLLPADQLDELFGPIALYPDALVALILPASTVPSDVVMAARYLDDNGDPAKVDAQGWDDSVTALTHYPDVVKWLDENLAWTKQAGEAFLAQPADVMNAIQRLRAKARAAGTLVDTPQQQVISEGANIAIIPAQPDVIYVPVYDPAVVYLPQQGPYDGGYLDFGIGYATGFWLGYDFDWGHRRIWTIDRHDRERYWRQNLDWRHPSYLGRPGYRDDDFHQQPWRPPVRPQRPSSPHGNRPRPEIPRPIPFPNRGPDHHSWERPPGEHGFRPDNGDRTRDNRERSRNPSDRGEWSGNRPDNGPRPARTVVPAGPASRPEVANPQNPATNPPPSQPQRPNPGSRDPRESRGHEPAAGSRNPQGRVTPLQPAPQPQPQPQPQARPQPQPGPTARYHSRTYDRTPAPSPQHSSRPQHEASSRQYRAQPSQNAHESQRDGSGRHDSRQ